METWNLWWNEQVDQAIQVVHAWFKTYSALGGEATEAKQAKIPHIDAKCMVKYGIWLAKSEAAKQEFATVSLDGDGALRIAKQMDRTNRVRIVYALILVTLCSLTKKDEGNNDFLRSLQLPLSLPVCPLPWSVKHSAGWNTARLLAHLDFWPIWHHNWDVKTAGEDGVELARQRPEPVFSCNVILGGKIHTEPLQGQGWSPWPWQLSWYQAHR